MEVGATTPNISGKKEEGMKGNRNNQYAMTVMATSRAHVTRGRSLFCCGNNTLQVSACKENL